MSSRLTIRRSNRQSCSRQLLDVLLVGRAIRLSNHGLLGTLPSSMSSLREVEVLDLSSNDLIGTVPTAVGFMTALRYDSNCVVRLGRILPVRVPMSSCPWSQ